MSIMNAHEFLTLIFNRRGSGWQDREFSQFSLHFVPSETNAALISPTPTHEEIASRISTHREAITLELARLEELGLIAKSGRTLRITNLSALRTLAGEHDFD